MTEAYHPDVVARFWAKVERARDADCWEWTAALDSYGYGAFKAAGKRVKAHRYALGLSEGIEPVSSQHALHSCDNPKCCNPSHLRWGDQLENMVEAARKGRHASQKRTHCPQGHPYRGENLIIGTNGDRLCRSCRELRKLENRRAA